MYDRIQIEEPATGLPGIIAIEGWLIGEDIATSVVTSPLAQLTMSS